MISKENILYNNISENQKLSAFFPDNFETEPLKAALIWFHGGSLERGKKEKFIPYAEQMTKNGIAFVTADYRLYPNAAYPDFIEDAADAVKKSVDLLSDMISCPKIFIGGSSAGAYLSAMLCFDESYLAKRGLNADSFGGYIFNSPQPTTHFNVLRERGMDKRRLVVDTAAPVYHIRDGRSYPRMLFVTASSDLANRTAQIRMTVDLLSVFGYGDRTEYLYMDGYRHCKYDLAKDENGRLFFADTVEHFIFRSLSNMN